MQWEHDDGVRVTTRRARIDKVNDKGSQQLVDFRGLKDEQPQKVWRPMDFGFTSVPPKDCDGVMVQMGSRSDRTLYLDGGHKDYRPKNTPQGCSALFNQFGDIIRCFQNNADVVHQKQINIRIGHGYAAGQSGDSNSSPGGIGGADNSSQIDDQQSKDTKTISVVLTGDAITLTYASSTVTIDSAGNITAQASARFAGGVGGGKWVVARAGRVDLGVGSPDEQAPNAVETTAGPSSIVFAVV
jgi:phage gp45-like